MINAGISVLKKTGDIPTGDKSILKWRRCQNEKKEEFEVPYGNF